MSHTEAVCVWTSRWKGLLRKPDIAGPTLYYCMSTGTNGLIKFRFNMYPSALLSQISFLVYDEDLILACSIWGKWPACASPIIEVVSVQKWAFVTATLLFVSVYCPAGCQNVTGDVWGNSEQGYRDVSKPRFFFALLCWLFLYARKLEMDVWEWGCFICPLCYRPQSCASLQSTLELCLTVSAGVSL